MRRGLVVAGIVLLLIGVVLAVLPFLQMTSTVIPEAGIDNTGYNSITPNFVGSGTITVSWSGATSSTHIVVYPCSGGCSFSATPIVNVSGDSGSFSFTAQGGSSYAMTEYGSSQPVSATVSTSGLTFLGVAGIALLVVGLILVVLGVRARARVAPEEMPESAPVEGPAEMAPPVPAPEVSGPAVVAAPVAEEPPEHQLYVPAEPQPAPGRVQSSSVKGSGSNKPARKCPNCGTINEPWITNCRKCKRPLATTGT